MFEKRLAMPRLHEPANTRPRMMLTTCDEFVLQSTCQLLWSRPPVDRPATVCRKISWRKSSRGFASCTQSLTSRKAPECSRSLASPAWFPHCSLNLSEEFSQVNRCSANLVHNKACGCFFQLNIYISPSKLEIASWILRKIIHILSILHHSGRPYSNLNSPIVTS